jgi:hypothetical protein
MAPTVALGAMAPQRKLMLTGESAHSLALQMTARAACNDKRILFVCGDNRFDPHAVSRFAKSAGVSPEQALRSISIARAFTAYQMQELIGRLPLAPPAELVVISGPCSTFFDEDLSLVDAARLFYRSLWQMVDLARNGMALLIVQGEDLSQGRRGYFLTDLCRASDVVLRLAGEHSFTIERHGPRPLPYLARIDSMTVN